ncbi:MAG: hypothetical protein WA139_03330 [Candidatus Aenigmatarchaeota archaeon]
MRKAISEIIVAVMLLMIAMALVGVAYVFIMQMNENTTAGIGQSNAQALKNIGSCLQTVSFDDKTNNLYVKNCGRYPIDNVSVFIDGRLSGTASINANPNDIKGITISASIGVHEIKIVGDHASATISLNVTK